MELEARLELKYEIGKKRRERIKERIEEALQELKDDRLIRSYLATGNLSFSIIYVKETYKVCSISAEKTRNQKGSYQCKFVGRFELNEKENSQGNRNKRERVVFKKVLKRLL